MPLLFPFLILVAGCSLMAEEDPVFSADDLIDAEIATVGMDHLSGSPVVLLREIEGGRAFPIWIGLSEAQAILQALHHIETPRPMTHDLAVQLLDVAGARLEEVIVHDMRGGIFYGLLRLRLPDRDEVVEVDCRPSDGLALAARTGARIRVAEKILADVPDVDFSPPDSVDQVVQVLGLTVVTVTDTLREEFGLGERTGVIITGVRKDAADRGFQRGDLIIQVNDLVPETPMDFLEELLRTGPGKEPDLRIWREGEEQQLQLPVTTESGPTIAI